MARIFICIFFLVILSACSTNQSYIESPQKGDIYIFEEAGIFFPMKVDSVFENTLYLVNSKFVFADAIPKKSEILDEEFDRSFFLIYEKEEIQRLFNEGKIIEVYR